MQNCICLQPALQLKAGGGLKVQQPALMAEWHRVKQQIGRIWERVCLQAASEAQPRMCCKTVVKQIGLFFTVCIARRLFFSLHTPPATASPHFSFWIGCLTPILPFCGTVCCIVAAGQQACEAGRSLSEIIVEPEHHHIHQFLHLRAKHNANITLMTDFLFHPSKLLIMLQQDLHMTLQLPVPFFTCASFIASLIREKSGWQLREIETPTHCSVCLHLYANTDLLKQKISKL